ncbi:MAG TPA: NDP-sugar synthase [Acidimicrobiia bacterium]
MRAVVLVGGEGTRLRPLTFETPKPLLPVANQVFLDRQLGWLAAYGVDEVGLSLGYLPSAFIDHYPEGTFTDPAGRTVQLHYAQEPTPLGTAGAVRFAAEQLGVRERFVVCNGDVLTGLDLGALLAFHEARHAEATIHLAAVEEPSRFGVVPTDERGRVLAFVEKPAPGTEPTRWINAGTYVLEPSVLERIAPERPVSIEFDTFPGMLETGGALYARPSDSYWIDVGAPAQYLQAHADLLAGRLGTPPAPGAREVSPGVWVQGAGPAPAGVAAPALVGERHQIDPSADVVGSVLGAGVQVGARATVVDAVVHDGVTIGPDATVRASIVGAGTVVGATATVEAGSIVGPHVTVDAGATLTGERRPPSDSPAARA